MANNNKNKILNVPNLRFPEFSGEWKKFSIEKLCDEFKSGKNIKADNILVDGAYPVYGGNGLRGFTDSYNHDGNYVLIGRQGALCGNVRFVTGKTYITEHAIAVQANKNNNTRFLEYLFVRLNLGQFSDQSAQPGLAVNKLLRIETFVPTVSEQERIVQLLQVIDERITTQNKIIDKLQSLIKGLIDDIITSQCARFVAFETLYSKAGEGGTPTTSNIEFYKNGNIPFIKIDDLSNKYLVTNKDYITELGLKKSSAWLIPANSIIYSNGATIGAISINKYQICTKQGILGIVPNSNIDVEYLYYFMRSSYFQKEVERVVTEGTMRTAYLKDINHIKCPIPDLDRQKEISLLFSVLSLKEDVERQLLQKYQIHKQYLLSQMFI